MTNCVSILLTSIQPLLMPIIRQASAGFFRIAHARADIVVRLFSVKAFSFEAMHLRLLPMGPGLLMIATFSFKAIKV